MRRFVLLAFALLGALPARATVPATTLAEQLLAAVAARDVAAVQALLAPDVVIELPFDASGRTGDADIRRFVGQAQAINYLSGAMRAAQRIAFVGTVIHPVEGGRIAFVEATGDMAMASGPYTNRYVLRVDARDGRIVGLREYFNPVTAAIAFGRPLGPQPAAR